MPIASVIVEIQNGASERVLGALAHIRKISVYGMKENQIVTVIEGDSVGAVQDVMKEVGLIDLVTGVYPVLVRDDE